MDSFIVRIYRYERDQLHRLLGTIEHVGMDGRKAFTNLDELWEVLNARREARTGKRGDLGGKARDEGRGKKK